MAKIETGCNKHNWAEIEPLLENHMGGKAIHVDSRDVPKDYGREATNIKEIFRGQK